MSRAERRYGNPPVIRTKQTMPTAAEAAAAAPVAKEAAGTDHIPVTTTVTKPGDLKV
jgi:hypothetical protein